MSELAADYYRERAERLGIKTFPPILNGEAITLLGDDSGARLSIQRPDAVQLKLVTTALTGIARSTEPFVLDGYRLTHPRDKTPIGETKTQLITTQKHLGSLIEQRLFPKSLQAGHVRNLRVETIARQEALDSHVRKARVALYKYYDADKLEGDEVYLLTTGELYAGRPLGHAACLTMITTDVSNGWSHDERKTYRVARYVTIPYSKNERLAQSVLNQSAANRWTINAWNAAHPQTQNFERGKRSR